MTGVAPEDETVATPPDVPAPAAEFVGEGAEAMDGPTVQIAYMHGSRVSHSWHTSMMNAMAYDKSLGSNLLRAMPFAVHCSGPNSITEGRNMAAAHFLDKTDADWLLFIDTDMGFRPDTIERLLSAAHPDDRPVIGALCFMLKHIKPDGAGGYSVHPIPTLFAWGRTPTQGYGFVSRFRYPPDTVVQVAGTGAAFLLVHRRVLADMRERHGDLWFNHVQYEDGSQVSEDLSFCYRLGNMDVPVFVHTGISVTHHKEFWLSEDDYRMPHEEPMARQMRAAKTEAPDA